MLRRWDEVTLALSNVGALASLLANVHPEEAVRTASENAEIEVDKLVTELRQDRALYEVFAGVDASGLDAGRGPAARQDARATSRAPASTATTRPGRGWPRSTSG